jgi:hypothetical protein
MGASEDRASLREHERQRRASEVEEIMVPGHGIWTREGIKELLEDYERAVLTNPDVRAALNEALQP